MALKGLDIFKLSPKKNCKECGSPTCMAFCMKVYQWALVLFWQTFRLLMRFPK